MTTIAAACGLMIMGAAAIGAEADTKPSLGALLFIGAEGWVRDERRAPATDDEGGDAFVDLLLIGEAGRWRALGEFLLASDEQELERLQLGFEPTDSSTLWLGRFHQPGSVWNFKHHHGQFLQPTISRPEIEKWEDDGGVLPQHVTGLMYEGQYSPQSACGCGLSFAIAVGQGALLAKDGLVTRQVGKRSPGPRQGTFSAKLEYLPDLAGETRLGVSIAHSEVSFSESERPRFAPYDHIDQFIYGLHAEWNSGDWTLTGVAYHVDTRFAAPDSYRDESFSAAYLQALKPISRQWQLQARVELTDGARRSNYVALFPRFVHQRFMLGARWDLTGRQAIAAEVSTNRAMPRHFGELRLQWTAVLP